MVNVNEFHKPRPVFKYEKIGDRLEGPIVDQPELQPDKFGDPGDKQLLLALQMGDTTFRDYSRNQKLQAVGEAVVEADATEIEDGGWISIELVGFKPTGAGRNPMKQFQATYIPPSQLGQAVFGVDDEIAEGVR